VACAAVIVSPNPLHLVCAPLIPSLRLLAAPALVLGDASPVPLPTNDALLVAMLALDGAMQRDALAGLLWPDNTPASARANLRQRVKRLQDSTGGQLLATQGQHLALGPDVRHDLQDMAVALQADPQAASGALLGALQVKNNPAASLWLDQARARVHAQRVRVLQACADALEQAQPLAALRYAQRLVSEDPQQESDHRRLMRLHYVRGDRGAALAAYRQLVDRLQEELGSPPDAQTEALARLIEGAAPLSPIPAPASGKVTVIAPEPPSAPAAATWAALIRPPRLVQREAEWAQLSHAWTQGGVVLALGEAGIGKTRLLHDFADSVGVPLRLQARLGDSVVPYALLARWVNALLPQAQQLPDWARAEVARLVPALGPSAEGPMSPLRLSQALGLLAQPLDAVVLDDLHFADAASLELLPTVLQPVRCCLLASRTHELPQAVRDWLEQASPAVTLLSLLPWQQEAVAELLRGAVVPADISAAWAPVLWRHTGGHPLLVLETLRAALLALPEGASLGAPPAALPLPPQVLQLVRLRLASMPALAQLIAQVASLAGDAFSPELAAAATAQPHEGLAGAWQALQDAALMGPQGKLHDLVLEAARSTLPAPLAQVLHARMAEHLATRGCPPARLALHWAAAAQPAKAAACHIEAAEAAAALSRRQELAEQCALAARCFEQAGDLDQAFTAWADEAEAYVTGGDVALGLARSEALLSRARNALQHAHATRTWSMALGFAGKWQPMLDAAAAAHNAAANAQRDDWRVDALMLRAIAAATLGQHALAEQCLAEEAAIPMGDTDWRRTVTRLSNTANAWMRLNRVHEALVRTERCIELTDRPDARPEHLVSLGNAAGMLFRLGQDERSLQLARLALQRAAEQGLQGKVLAINVRQHAGVVATGLGQFGAARADLEQCVLEARQHSVRHVLNASQALAWVWAMLGQPARALQCLRMEEAEFSATDKARTWALQACMHRWCGSAAPAPEAPLLDATVDVVVAAAARIEHALTLPAADQVQRLDALARECQDKEMPSCALRAQVWQLPELARLNPAAAAELALTLRTRLVTAVPTLTYWPEAQWLVHRALLATGQAQAARQALADAWAWVQRVHDTQVPVEFQDSFMHRNRVNLAIQRAWKAGAGR
jgi:DNA-binding SARP family transcriptional activator